MLREFFFCAREFGLRVAVKNALLLTGTRLAGCKGFHVWYETGANHQCSCNH